MIISALKICSKRTKLTTEQHHLQIEFLSFHNNKTTTTFICIARTVTGHSK